MKSVYRPEFIIILMAAVCISLGAFAQCDYNNLVVNGDFSSGNAGFSSSYRFCEQALCLYAEDTYTVASDVQIYHPDFLGADHTSGDGNYLIVNGAGTHGTEVWTQTIPVNPNTEYNFSAWVSSLTLGEVAQLQFSINSDVLGDIYYAPSSIDSWENFDIMWNSGDATTATISILDQNTTATGNDFGLDDIRFVESCALAAHFLDISAFNKNSATELRWSTISERASNYFEVQRSTDGINFNSIGKVKARGNSESIAHYTFEDVKEMPRSFYYRVVEYDVEGRKEFSSIVTSEEKSQIVIFPNPCTDNLHIIFQEQIQDFIYIGLTDIAGRDIPLHNKMTEATVGKRVYDLSDLISGVYFLNIKTVSGRKSEKIIIP